MKAKFTGEGGYELDRKYAFSKLEIGKTYDIDEASIGKYSSTVRINGEWFNSVMFDLTIEDLMVEFPNSTSRFY